MSACPICGALPCYGHERRTADAEPVVPRRAMRLTDRSLSAMVRRMSGADGQAFVASLPGVAMASLVDEAHRQVAFMKIRHRSNRR